MTFNNYLPVVLILHLLIALSYSKQYDLTIIIDNNFISEVCIQTGDVIVNTTDSIYKCNSLSSAMTVLSNAQSIEMVFSPGVHVLNQTMTFPATNITLRSATDDESKLPPPRIICSNDLQLRLQQSANKSQEAVPVLEFVNISGLVEIYDIHFEGCIGSVSIQNASHLIIMNSLFR